MRASVNCPASWVGPVVGLSMLLAALPTLAADTATVQQEPEITIVQGTVTITTTGDRRFAYVSMPPKVIGAPLSAAFVVSYAHSTDSPIEFEGDAELIYDGKLLIVIPSVRPGWVFRLDLQPHAVAPSAAHPAPETNGLPEAGRSPLLAVPPNVVAIEKRWWDRGDFPFPTTHEEFVKWHQQLLKNLARPSFPT